MYVYLSTIQLCIPLPNPSIYTPGPLAEQHPAAQRATQHSAQHAARRKARRAQSAGRAAHRGAIGVCQHYTTRIRARSGGASGICTVRGTQTCARLVARAGRQGSESGNTQWSGRGSGRGRARGRTAQALGKLPAVAQCAGGPDIPRVCVPRTPMQTPWRCLGCLGCLGCLETGPGDWRLETGPGRQWPAGRGYRDCIAWRGAVAVYTVRSRWSRRLRVSGVGGVCGTVICRRCDARECAVR